MKYVDILAAFETEIGSTNDPTIKPLTDDALFWLNQAVVRFVKQRFNGDLVKQTGFEQTEKRREDLINLVSTYDYEEFVTDVTTHSDYDSYSVEYPEDFLYVLNEDVVISDLNGEYQMDTCVFECTRDSYMYRINNSLTDFHYRNRKARPLRVRYDGGCYLLTDKQYQIKKYTLGYLRQPSEITLEKPFDEYKDFSDTVMSEIIKQAASLYLENIANDRYKTLSQEVLIQE